MKKTLLFLTVITIGNFTLACSTCKSCLAKKATKEGASNLVPLIFFDQNSDGKFTKAEKDVASNLQHHLIKAHDANKDNQLKDEELNKAIISFKALVKEFDKNGDGKLSKMESAKAHDALESKHSH